MQVLQQLLHCKMLDTYGIKHITIGAYNKGDVFSGVFTHLLWHLGVRWTTVALAVTRRMVTVWLHCAKGRFGTVIRANCLTFSCNTKLI